MPRTTTTLIATMPNGVVPPTAAPPRRRPVPRVNLTEHVGGTIDHPTPCRHRWHDDSPFAYFRTYSPDAAGEITEFSHHWPVDWPLRLFRVQPLGRTGHFSRRHRYQVLTHRLRVLEETDPALALGPRGARVLAWLRDTLPEQARAWAAQHQADPERTDARHTRWLRSSPQEAFLAAETAQWHASQRAHATRRHAALQMAQKLAGISVHTALHEHVPQGAAHDYAHSRARAAVTHVLMADHLEDETATTLRGSVLDLSNSGRAHTHRMTGFHRSVTYAKPAQAIYQGIEGVTPR